MDEDDRLRRRVQLVLKQVARDYGHGWQSRLEREATAKGLELGQTNLSKISSGQRGKRISAGFVTALRKTLGVPEVLFTDPKLAKADYKDYVGARTVDTTELGRTVVREWLASDDAVLVTPAQADRLLSIDWGGVEVDRDMVRDVWARMDAKDRRRAVADRAADQTPEDIGDKRQL